ncbi:hypothetical protein SCOR_23175 [Sulfidibacter corallicola]|uniref:Uncharacterized protein n=1 Tax=Sulfidibacter corallicola TaxID=2818388 RepID=A0A8A4TTI3_SULCO|nr:hypothetical protein [Sulfidibacter corallicola]QTD52687.1 hypothetical protein J3U87_09445 [Sulfidibacter corallicola]
MVKKILGIALLVSFSTLGALACDKAAKTAKAEPVAVTASTQAVAGKSCSAKKASMAKASHCSSKKGATIAKAGDAQPQQAAYATQKAAGKSCSAKAATAKASGCSAKKANQAKMAKAEQKTEKADQGDI